MSRDNEPTECGEFVVKALTDDALLLVDAGEDEYWIPKSQIALESGIQKDSEPGDKGELILPEWLAVEKGLV